MFELDLAVGDEPAVVVVQLVEEGPGVEGIELAEVHARLLHIVSFDRL